MLHQPLRIRRQFVALLALAAALALFSGVQAGSTSVDFEGFTTGTVNNQGGWLSMGAAGSGCAVYDHQIVDNTGASYSYPAFGSRSLRISNAVTSGCFSDHTFSGPLPDNAGETSATGDGYTSGTRWPYFEAQWQFASTVPTAEQPGMNLTASPDRGDGARMSWINMADTPTGVQVSFYDYQRSAADFVQTTIASGLDRAQPHTLRVTMTFIEGSPDQSVPDNDIVCIFVDGVLRHQGNSWENYFRDAEGNPTHPVDSILFRTGGTAAPATLGKGFLIDNLSQYAGPIPTGFDIDCTPPAATPQPTAAPGASAGQPPLCSLLGGGTSPVVRADATPYQFCRLLVENGTYVQPAAEIGDRALIDAGIWQAVDIFAYAAGDVRVTVFDQPLTVCLLGSGTLSFRDANGQPRVTVPLAPFTSGDYTCGVISSAGTVILSGPSA